MNLEFSSNDVMLICAALEYSLDDLEEERKEMGPKNAAQTNIMATIRSTSATLSAFRKHEPFTEKQLCLAFAALDEHLQFLEDILPMASNAAERSVTMQMRNETNRLLKRLKPICIPILQREIPGYK